MYYIIRFFYNILLVLALPFILLKNLWRSRISYGYRKRTLERLGFAPFRLNKPIWIHSVSMGESIAIAPLVKKLIKKYPNNQFLVTTMSVTGSDYVKKTYKDFPQVNHAYLPYDLSLSLSIFLKRTNPKCLIIMETELWPNLLALCHKKKIPTILTNARLSQKSYNGYRKVQYLSNKMLNQLTAIAVQNKTDGQRFIDLGFPANHLEVTGSLKFDIQISPNAKEQGLNLKASFNQRPVWIAASTHLGEDEIIVNAHQKLLESIPNALLIVVPRHPERFDTVSNLLKKHFHTSKRSLNETVTDSTQTYLADTMGEMMTLLQASDIAFIGGSLINRGGHNMLEPAALKLPVLSGPNTFNFADITKSLLDANALIIVKDAQSLYTEVKKLMLDQSLLKQYGDSAYQVVQANQGSLMRQFNLICQIIEAN